MGFRSKVEGLARKLISNPVKTAVIGGLIGLSALTLAKDNVHFGSVTLNNPQGNQYVWGVWPITKIKGDLKGNLYSGGLIGGNVVENNSQAGNLSAYFLIGANTVGDNSQAENLSSYCGVGGNKVENNSQAGDFSEYGLLGGTNKIGNNSQAENLSIRGLIYGLNRVGKDSKIRRGMSANSLLVGSNRVGDKTEVNEYIISRGLVAYTPKRGFECGSDVELGIESYVHIVPETK